MGRQTVTIHPWIGQLGSGVIDNLHGPAMAANGASGVLCGPLGITDFWPIAVSPPTGARPPISHAVAAACRPARQRCRRGHCALLRSSAGPGPSAKTFLLVHTLACWQGIVRKRPPRNPAPRGAAWAVARQLGPSLILLHGFMLLRVRFARHPESHRGGAARSRSVRSHSLAIDGPQGHPR
jgi:hypothetical protein